ncbi:ParM/StbA family protein [Moorella naiadis]|uniref:ParM/StbA family protein n=1 Tax=Moorella naiadis (nom. illeg.) TaxID=3093670 RepID=UPI003D9C85B3
MFVAVDLGYGYTKAVSSKARTVFPSAIAPYSENVIDAGLEIGYVVELRPAGSMIKKQYFIGEMALKRGRAVQMTLAREKFAQEASLLLTLAGAYLAGAEGQVDLAYGLPLAYYKTQRAEAQKALQGFAAYIKIDGGPEKYIAFNGVYIFPQGVGALFSLDSLPKEGLVGLIDVGYYTCDYLLVGLRPNGVEPLPAFMSSIEVGVSTALKEFAEKFQRVTGRPLSLTEANNLWGRDTITFAGKKMDIGGMVEEARQETGRTIADSIMAAWSEKIDFLDLILLAGGGSLEFLNILQRQFGRHVEIMPDPQYANALGFYKMASRQVTAAKANS